MLSINNAEKYLNDALNSYSKIKDQADLNGVRSKYISSKSELINSLKSLKDVEPELRKNLGRTLNNIRMQIEEVDSQMQQSIIERKQFKPIDMSAPALNSPSGYGHIHPTTAVLKETYDIFSRLGFAIVDSDEIETDWYNFEALNMPVSHPARDMQDTFYIDNGKNNLLPRSHTSGMQVRFMEQNKPPFKIIVPGRVFRNENEDATHAWIFNQVEGLVVGEGVSMSDLKGTLLSVVKGILGEDADIRFRASYFPYTEPSVELDCWYNERWLELGGAGMVHPQVLLNGGIDPNKYTGFAFGWGAERIAVIKYGLTDLRELWRPRFSFLEQF